MIKNVTWSEYWTVVAVLCTVYYVVVIFLYYRKEFIDIVSGKKKLVPTQAAPPTSSPHPFDAGPRQDKEEKLFGLANQLMQEIAPVFRNKHVKGELITALQMIIRRYEGIKGTAFQVSVNNFIQMESENQCSVTLSEGELRGLW